MASPSLLKRLTDGADELVCRLSNSKVDLFTELGKRMLPPGFWGHDDAIAGAWTAPTDNPTVYLTFDDGPDPHTTPRLLSLLEEQQTAATFFLVGSHCKRHPELVKRIFESGHSIGNHSYNHRLLPFLTQRQLQNEIVATNQVIADITGSAPTMFRPPFGWMDERAAQVLNAQGMTPVYWRSAPEDWAIPGSHRIIRRVMWKIADGTLIVLHEGGHLGEQTITAAGEIISRARSLGYQFSQVNLRARFQTP